jgi:hypothetical protein
MQRLNPDKLHVKYLAGTGPEQLTLPRSYTLTHSDMTGDLFLSIGSKYNTEETSKLYTRLMRDEVLAELSGEGDRLVFRIYCHVSRGVIVGTAKWRYEIFQSELPLVLEAIRYSGQVLFKHNPELDDAPVFIHFESNDRRFNKVENWGTMAKYK